MTNSLHFSEWRNCIRAQWKVNLCAPGAPKGPKVGMFVRQYEIVCANDAGRAPRKYPANVVIAWLLIVGEQFIHVANSHQQDNASKDYIIELVVCCL